MPNIAYETGGSAAYSDGVGGGALIEEQQHIWRAFMRICSELPQRLDAQLQAEVGLALPAFDILALLGEAREQSLRMSELAALANSSPSRLSHLIERLEKSGWVIRIKSAQDRRGSVAVLTQLGQQELQRGLPVQIKIISQFFGLLSEHQLSNVQDIINTVLSGLDAGAGNEP
jgi:DNA-binding MarR family transcriptional regulator